jgi:glutathione S-transferase
MSLGTLYSDGPLCPFTHRVLIAVSELEADIEVVYGDAIPTAIREANTSGTWPAFETADGELIEDSPEIVDSLIEASGDRGAAYTGDDDVLARLNVVVGCISKIILNGDPEIQRAYREKLDRALADLGSTLAASGGPYLCGETFTQADGHVVPFLYRLPFMEEIRGYLPPALRENAELRRWVDRSVARRSFQAIAPDLDALRRFYAQRAT